MSFAVAAASIAVTGGVLAAGAAKANADLVQGADNLNSKYAELDAYDAAQSGNTKAARYENTINETVGAQKTTEAAENVNVNFGTAAQITGQTKLTGFLNQLDMQQQATQQALGYKVQANNYILAGENAEISGQATATGDIISGIGGAAAASAKSTTPAPPASAPINVGSSGYNLGNYDFNEGF
jgi:hypothetical protein